jgi:hypothetical protein
MIEWNHLHHARLVSARLEGQETILRAPWKPRPDIRKALARDNILIQLHRSISAIMGRFNIRQRSRA